MKEIVKQFAFSCLRTTRFFSLTRWLTRNGIMIIGWHGVSMEDEHNRFPDLFISPQSFREKLAFLAKHYSVISLEEAVTQIRRREVKPKQVVLTFDDGFYNFAVEAAPILKQFDMPATVYLTTEYSECQLPVPNLLLRDAIGLSELEEVHVCINGENRNYILSSHVGKASLTFDLLSTLNDLPMDPRERADFINPIITDVLQVDLERLVRKRIWHLLSRDEVSKLSNQGFTFELHTHKHLSVTEFPEKIANEISVNRKSIEEATNGKTEHFCYPSGRWNRDTWKILDQCQVRSAVTCRLGPNFHHTPLLSMRRVMCGESKDMLQFEYEMSNLRFLFDSAMNPRSFYRPTEVCTPTLTPEQVYYKTRKL